MREARQRESETARQRVSESGKRAAGAVAWVGVAALFLALTVQKLWSADTWTLLSIGRWVVEHRAWPRVEEWSYTAAGRDWHELRWLFGVVMYELWELGGAAAVVVGQSVLVGAAFGVLMWGVRGSLVRPGVIGLIGLGLCAGASRWVMRPELMTYVMIAVFLVGLEGVALRKHGPWVWVLPLLQVVWTNAHPMFVFGPVLAWTAVGAGCLESGGAAEQRSSRLKSVRWLVVVAVLVSAACFVNPYGLEGAMQPVRLFAESQGGHVVSKHISEMQAVLGSPVRSWRLDTWAAVILIAVVVALSAMSWRRVGWFRVLVLVQACYLLAGPQRNLGLVAVMGTWVGLGVCADSEGARHGRGVRVGAAVGVACAALLGAWLVASDRYWKWYGIDKEFGLGVVAGSTAKGAADFVLENGARGRVYNGMGDGGYLIWRGIVPVYVDGRMEIRSEEFLREYFEGGGPDWGTMVRTWGINTVILPRKGIEWLTSILEGDRAWVRVYEDGRNVVYVRDTAEHAGLIAKWRKAPVSTGG